MSNVAARFVVSPNSPIETQFKVNVQSNDHNLLQNRDLSDQHPIGAITGLQEALDNIPDDYVTDAELEAALLEKQDVISDLETIRSGAALGATAIQPNDNISELTNNANYQTATQVANYVATETTNRENADNNLQSQIDAIVSSSDVFDIVGTYAELQAYDITTVPVNDIIKVLVDSTHSGAATYYRCVETGGVKSWSYIGSEGAYYTKGEADAAFVPQTRTVNSKALSSNITLTASDVGALPSSTVIPTVNNPTITITQGGVTKGSFTLNQATGDTIALDTGGGSSYTAGTGVDITNNVISVTSPTLTNTATGTDGIVILGSEYGLFKGQAVAIGKSSSVSYAAVAIGYGAVSRGGGVSIGNTSSTNTATYAVAIGNLSTVGNNSNYSIAIGNNAIIGNAVTYAIQLGQGTNSEANSFYVSTSASDNWKMLGSDGKIPSGRLPIATSVSSSSTNDETVGAKLFYDTCGDIETLINAL